MNAVTNTQIDKEITVLNTTASICNECLKRVPAEVYEKNNVIYIRKTCDEHGTFESPHVWDDPETYKYLIKFEKFQFPSRKVLFNLTNDCNMNCHFCYAKANEIDIKELSFEDVKKMDLSRFEYIFLSGGEPTIKDDLFEIIRYLKKNGKKVFVLTNGIKIANPEYAKGLKKSRVDMVVLQFDSLYDDDIQYLRGISLLETKLKVIENLNTYKIPTYFFSIQLKKNNIRNMKALVKYFNDKKEVIKGINFNTIWKIGRYDDENWMSTKSITDNSCEVLGVKKEDYLISTEFMYYLFILIASWKNKRRYFSRCLTFLLVIYNKDQIIPITKIFNLKKLSSYIKAIVIEKKKWKIFPLIGYALFSQMFLNFFLNKNYRIFFFQSVKKLRYLFHRNVFLLNPLTTFNVGEFPTAEDFDYNFVDTCNLFYFDPEHNSVLPVCMNQIKFARSNHPLYSK